MTGIAWEVVPERFHYLRPAVELCGETRVWPYNPLLKRHNSFTDRATSQEIECLASLHNRILKQNDLAALYEWLDVAANGSEAQRTAAWFLNGVLAAIDRLAEQDVAPFCDAPLGPPPSETALVNDKSISLPRELSYLIGPALHFSERYGDDLQMLEFLNEASKEECEWLAEIAERVRVNRHWPDVLKWLDEIGSRHVAYSWEIDDLFRLMDYCGFGFEPE